MAPPVESSSSSDRDGASAALLEISNLTVSFGARAVVRGLGLSIHPGQIVAVVGESGSGKSVTALSVMGLLPRPAARLESGSIRFDGRELTALGATDMRKIRGRDIAMIFQEPMSSLNPVFTIGEQLIESVMLHQDAGRSKAFDIAASALAETGIADAPRRMKDYPHQFSGGMRQRVMIAMALACRPRLLLADEPTTALDVTVQAQILSLLRSLRESRGLAIMLITHDLGVVAQNADVVSVMLAGRIVEHADVFTLFARPLHPYTRGLLACRPSLGRRVERLRTIREADLAEDPQASLLPGGCTPWRPAREPGTPDPACSLREVEPRHWVAMAADQAEASNAARPGLAFRRIEPAQIAHLG